MNLSVSSRILPSLKSPIKSLSGLALSIWGKQSAAMPSPTAANDSKGSIDLCKTSLLSVIESQIIPRLLDAHPSVKALDLEQAQGELVAASEQDMLDFAQACLATDSQAVFNHLDVLRDKGLGTQTVFLDVITPAARYLGDLWEQDKMDFTVVAQGLLRMHHAMRHLGYEPKTALKQQGMFVASCWPLHLALNTSWVWPWCLSFFARTIGKWLLKFQPQNKHWFMQSLTSGLM